MTRVRNYTMNEWTSDMNHDDKCIRLVASGWHRIGEVIDEEGITWTRFRLNANMCEVMKQ